MALENDAQYQRAKRNRTRLARDLQTLSLTRASLQSVVTELDKEIRDYEQREHNHD